MPSLPFMPLFTSDFVADTNHLSPEEVGCYLRLLCHQWSTGTVPSDHVRLSRIVGLDPQTFENHVWPLLEEFFPEGDDGRRSNDRLSRERAKATTLQAQRVAAGRKGGKAKPKAKAKRSLSAASSGDEAPLKQSSSRAKAEPEANGKQSPSNPYPYPEPEEIPKGISEEHPLEDLPRGRRRARDQESSRGCWRDGFDGDDWCDRVAAAYPKGVRSLAMEQALWQLQDAPPPASDVVAAIETLSESAQWRAGDPPGRFVPRLDAFVRDRGWQAAEQRNGHRVSSRDFSDFAS